MTRGGSVPSVGHQVLSGELALPGIGHRRAPRGELVAPGEGGAVEAAASGELPLRLGGPFLAGPGRVGVGVLGGDVGDWVLDQALDTTTRAVPLWPAEPVARRRCCGVLCAVELSLHLRDVSEYCRGRVSACLTVTIGGANVRVIRVSWPHKT